MFSNFSNGFPLVQLGNCVYYSTRGVLAEKWLNSDCAGNRMAYICELPPTFKGNWTNSYSVGHRKFRKFSRKNKFSLTSLFIFCNCWKMVPTKLWTATGSHEISSANSGPLYIIIVTFWKKTCESTKNAISDKILAESLAEVPWNLELENIIYFLGSCHFNAFSLHFRIWNFTNFIFYIKLTLMWSYSWRDPHGNVNVHNKRCIYSRQLHP